VAEIVLQRPSIHTLIGQLEQRDHPSLAGYGRSLDSAAPRLGVTPIVAPVGSASEIERTFETLAREPNGGLLLPPDQFLVQHRELIVASAARHHLPAVYGYRHFVTAGGLVSYGVDVDELTGARQATLIAFSRARNWPTFRCRRQQSTSWRST
jgi:ABC-type uncharacterized transport system substrate-binding protein